MRLIVLLIVLTFTGCINVTVVAPTPPLPATSTPALPSTPRPEPTLEIREYDDGELIPEPALNKYEITIKGKVIDNVTREHVENARAVFITETGTHIFEDGRYRFTIPSGSVMRFIITAPGYEKVDKLFKPRLLRNATIDMDITIGKEKGRIGSSMSELKLLVWENDERLLVNPTDFDCVICGLSQDYRCVGAMLIEERDDDLLLKIGDVCLYCVVAGKSGAGERARERARYLRTGTEYRHLMHGKEKLLEKWATEREAMARQVARVIRWTTPQEQIAARAALAEMEAGLEPEE